MSEQDNTPDVRVREVIRDLSTLNYTHRHLGAPLSKAVDLIESLEKERALHERRASTWARHAVEIDKELSSLRQRCAEALRSLESANDAVCAGRPRDVYLAMLDAGQSDALLALDEARYNARALHAELTQPNSSGVLQGPDDVAPPDGGVSSPHNLAGGSSESPASFSGDQDSASGSGAGALLASSRNN